MQRHALCSALLCTLALSACSTIGDEQTQTRSDAAAPSNQPSPAVVADEAEAKSLDSVVVPIGGGGLIAGILVAIKESNPRIRVYGVEPRGAAAMRQSMDSGRAVQLSNVSTIADGLAAPMAGDLNFEVVRRYVDDVVVIDDDAIADAVRELLTSAKILAETGGAAATAAVLTRAIPLRAGERVAAIVSGGNIDAGRLAGLLG